MQPNQARNQMLALGLLVVLGLISLDLAPVQALVSDVLAGPPQEEREALADEPQAPRVRAVRGPSLAARGEADDLGEACLGCTAPQVIAVESALAEAVLRAHTTEATAAFLPTLWVSRPKAWSTLAVARRALQLDAAQRFTWALALQDARRDMDDLRHVQNDGGASWHSISASILDAGGDTSKALALARRLAAFASSPLRGGETYAEARGRLLVTYTNRLRAELTPEQLPLFEAHDIGPLFDHARTAATGLRRS